MTDILAQIAILAVILIGLWKRDILDDLGDGNVERLERDDHAAEAATDRARIPMSERLIRSDVSEFALSRGQDYDDDEEEGDDE